MSRSHDYFPQRLLCSSNGFVSPTSIRSNENRPLIETRLPNSPQVVYSQQGSMSVNNHPVIPHRSYTILHQEELRQLGALAPTFPANASVVVPRRLPWVSSTRIGIPIMMPQMYGVNRRECMGSTTSFARSTSVHGYPELVPTHQAVSNHASSSTNVGYHHQALKRKAMMTELSLGSLNSAAVESAINDSFGFVQSFQEEQTHSANMMMTPLLIYEEDSNEAAERMEREIPFFPQHVAHEQFGNESEFSFYEMSSAYVDGFDAALDLSLNLSSSCGESSMAIDLSLKLNNNPCT